MDLIESLRRVPLFSHLSEEHLRLVAGIGDECAIDPGEQLCRQADLGAKFFIIASGEAVVRRVDEHGLQRPVGMMRAGDSFGTTSLFLGEPRDATVIAVSEVGFWEIGRADFQELLTEYPRFRRQIQSATPDEVRAKLNAPRYPWLDPGELVVYHCRRHWMVFARSMLLGTILITLYVLFIVGLSRVTPKPLNLSVLILPLLPVYVLVFLWHWFDWHNDYFAVSTRRITHRERVAFFYESRNEAPLDRVQNINIARGFLGQMLHFGDVTIETAAEIGSMLFDSIPWPEEMSEAIWTQTARAQSLRRATERQLIREALAAHMDVETTEPPPEVNPGEEMPVDYGEQPEASEVRAGYFTRAIGWLVKRDMIPWVRVETPESVTWRKHWIFLLVRVICPLLLSIILGTASVLGFFGIPHQIVAFFPFYPFVILFLAMLAMGWLWWQFADWGDDQYIVTDQRIIDIEKRPFFFSEERREASLGMIQNVSLEVPSFLAATLHFGNVIVQTAGAGEFTFDKVPNPHDVQSEIFQRMEAFREAQRQREAARRRAEMAEWFSVYGEVRGEAGFDESETEAVDLEDI